MWRYNHTSAYIASRIAATATDPELDTYRANSTDCSAAAAVASGAVGVMQDSVELAERSLSVSVGPAVSQTRFRNIGSQIAR